jgi:branched-chain amino acid transport system ATP-binding protein
MTDSTVLEAVHVYKSFGKTPIINDFSLKVERGQRHAIIGPNGAGKTTLYNLFSGRYEPTAGRIMLNGSDITGLPPYKINRLGMARSFQITNIFPKLTVFENVRAAAMAKHHVYFNFFANIARWKQPFCEALAVIEQTGLRNKRDVRAGNLAYGEQRALEIALTVASDPQVILLDEPTAGMSVDETREAIKLINAITRGKTLIIIEHDMEVIFNLADTITVLQYGKVLTTGSPNEIRGDPRVKEAYLGDQAVCYS